MTRCPRCQLAKLDADEAATVGAFGVVALLLGNRAVRHLGEAMLKAAANGTSCLCDRVALPAPERDAVKGRAS